jgi:hypothetical protein
MTSSRSFSILHAGRVDTTRTFNLNWQLLGTARDGRGGLVRVDEISSCPLSNHPKATPFAVQKMEEGPDKQL